MPISDHLSFLSARGIFANRDLNLLFATVAALALLFWLLVDYLAAIFVAVFLAYLLETIVRPLCKIGVPRALAALFATAAGVATVIVLAYSLPFFVVQLQGLSAELPRIANFASNIIDSINSRLPENFHLRPDVGDFAARANDAFASLFADSWNYAINAVALAVYVFVAPLAVFFMLKDKERLLRWCARYLPKSTATKHVFEAADADFGKYMRGKVIEAVLVFAAAWIAFLAFGLNFAFALALMTGASVFIPFVGAAVVTFPVVLTALLQFGFSSDFALVVAAYAIIQIIDAQILVPILFSEVVRLHPIAIFTAIIFFGNLWGVWGVFFAIPLASFLKSVLLLIDQEVRVAREAAAANPDPPAADSAPPPPAGL